MTSLGPDATVAEVEDEIEFTRVLINSLDTGAEDFESRSQELSEQVLQLETLLTQALNSPRRAGQQHNASMQNTPIRQPQSSGEWSNSSGPSTSYGMKRPVSSLTPGHDRPSKRQTSSQSTSEGHTDRARQRQLAAEAAMKRIAEQHRADEEYARHVSQAMNRSDARMPGWSSRPAYQSTLGPNGAVLPSIRPTLNDDTRSSSSQAHASHIGQSSPQVQIKAEPFPQGPISHRPRDFTLDVVDLTADSDDERVSAGSSRWALPGPPLLPSTPQQYSQMPQASSSSHTAQPFSVPGAHPQFGAQYPGGSSMVYRGTGFPQPGAVHPSVRKPTFAEESILSRWGGQAAMHMYNRMQAAGAHVSSELGQLNNLINGSRSNPHFLDNGDEDDDDDEDVQYQGQHWRMPTQAADPYANYSDLYRQRYEQLEQYNPEKTKEELNALLLNIRPDEELPDHLLVSTPEAMTIKLHKYQELGLTWLQKAEEGSNKGGILADDMGLGKTIQMISLIVTRKSEDPRCKTTLVVAPVALLRQWKQEIEQKVKPGRHALSVFIHHGQSKKNHWRDLQVYDVVITTFGSLAAELKRLERFNLRLKNDPEARPRKDEQCTLIDPDCRWYRVILDEAQCIKNKSTQTAKAAFLLKATYRFCMTGTPMMNNVTELYSLVNFLRIRPYNKWEKFNLDFARPLKGSNGEARAEAMRMLQILCKAIMLRRTKKSEYRGKPILILPERTTEVDAAEFDEDEQSLYASLEQRTQITFNKYLRAGTVGRSYSAILVLLLRLRQACCHPHLIKDFSIAAAADLSDDALLDLAKELSDPAVARIKATEGNFECPICMDACLNPAIFLPCGHDTCRDCYVKLADPSRALQEGQEGAVKARCPHCRGDIDPKRITDFISFKRVHMPELLTEDERAQFGVVEDDDSETESEDSETESESEDETLGGFIVRENADKSETESEAEEADNAEQPAPSKKGKKAAAKSKKSRKAKGKAKAKPQLTLAELKKRATRNVKAHRKYLRKLREQYTDSAKIRKMMELLCTIMEGPQDEEDERLDSKSAVFRQSGEKVLIFSQWTSLLDLCEVEIDNKGWGYRRYDGSMNAKMRADAVDDFKDARKDVRIMLVSLKAGNAGLNLNVASQVIILDPFWNPYIEEQAIDRAHRIGQTRAVKVHRVLVEATVEDRIIALQESKRKLIEQALDEQQASQLSRLGAQELAYLFGVTRNINDRVDYREGGR